MDTTLTIKSMYDGSFSLYDSLTKAQKQKAIATIKHIEKTGREFGLPILDMDLTQYFTVSEKNVITETNKGIWNILFDLDPATVKQGTTIATLDEDKVEKALKALEQFVSQETKALEKKNADIEKTISSKYNEISRCYNDIQLNLAKLDQFKVSVADRARKALEDSLSSGDWNLEAIKGNKMIFTTATNIVLTHSNPSANIDLRVDMGKYGVEIDITNLDVRVVKFENNRTFESKIHPHVDSDGHFCWGNTQDMYNEARKTFNLPVILNIVFQMLNSYTQGVYGGVTYRPYASLDKFANVTPSRPVQYTSTGSGTSLGDDVDPFTADFF